MSHMLHFKKNSRNLKQKISVTYQINISLNPNCDIFTFCSIYLSVMTTAKITRVRREIVITLRIIPEGHHLAG